MTDPKMFRRGADGRDDELRGSTAAREREQRRRVGSVLEQMPAAAPEFDRRRGAGRAQHLGPFGT